MKNVYKFVKWDVPELDTLKDTRPYKLLEKLNTGKKLTRAEKNSLNLVEYHGRIHLQGYSFDFNQYLKTYWVQTRYSGIQSHRAFDKTHLRAQLKAAYYYNNYDIIKIIEVSD